MKMAGCSSEALNLLNNGQKVADPIQAHFGYGSAALQSHSPLGTINHSPKHNGLGLPILDWEILEIWGMEPAEGSVWGGEGFQWGIMP